MAALGPYGFLEPPLTRHELSSHAGIADHVSLSIFPAMTAAAESMMKRPPRSALR